jgi:hypothetical protein
VDAEEIDPRYATGVVELPAYRVECWATGTTLVDGHPSERACWTWRLTSAQDVQEVLSWVDSNQLDREAVVYVEHPALDASGQRDLTLLRILGREPR